LEDGSSTLIYAAVVLPVVVAVDEHEVAAVVDEHEVAAVVDEHEVAVAVDEHEVAAEVDGDGLGIILTKLVNKFCFDIGFTCSYMYVSTLHSHFTSQMPIALALSLGWLAGGVLTSKTSPHCAVCVCA
jgi:hypothetical protein